MYVQGRRAPRSVNNPEKVSEFVRRRVAADPVGALRDAQRAYLKGREEKQLANQHRRRSQAAMFTFQEFKRHLEALGIEVIFEPGPEHKQSPMLRSTSEPSSKDSSV